MNSHHDDVLDFYEFGQDLKSMDAVAGPAEAHGILCGQLCTGARLSGLGWLKQFLPLLGVKREPWESLRQRLQMLRLCSEERLGSADLDFLPLLPDDEEPIEGRLNALSEWCSGFLAGFGSLSTTSAPLPDEEANVLRDLRQICDVDVASANEEGEQGEVDYVEVVEYVRMSVISLYQERQQSRPPESPEGDAPSGDVPVATLH